MHIFVELASHGSRAMHLLSVSLRSRTRLQFMDWIYDGASAVWT